MRANVKVGLLELSGSGIDRSGELSTAQMEGMEGILLACTAGPRKADL